MPSDIYRKTGRKAIPTTAVTVINARGEEPNLASSLDAQTVHGILRAAEMGDCSRLWSLYRDILIGDTHIQAELTKRKLAVLGAAIVYQPWDTEDPADVTAAETVEAVLGNAPALYLACAHLLDAVLWPVSVVEKVYAIDPAGPIRYRLNKLIPVPHRFLDYREGILRILEAEPETGRARPDRGAEPDPNRYIVHRGHLLSTPDQFGGPMRSLVWWWLFSAMDRHWWARFLERYGAPFLVGKHPAGDDAARRILEAAFSYAVRLGGLVVSDSASVEIKEATNNSGDAFASFHTIARREISKLILGQTLSAEAQSTGLGSGVASEHGSVRRDYRRNDGRLLGQTLRDQLAEQILRINGIAGRPPTILWAEDTSEDAARAGKLLSDLSLAGIEPDDDALYTISEKVGFAVRRKSAPAPDTHPFSAAREVGASAFFRRERSNRRVTGF